MITDVYQCIASPLSEHDPGFVYGTLVLSHRFSLMGEGWPITPASVCYLLLNPLRFLFGQRLERNAEPLSGRGAIREQGDMQRRMVR
jgi:hypothetical protein